MKRAVAVALACLLIAPPFAEAQQPAGRSEWSLVRRIEYGTSVEVALRDGRRLAFRVLGADDSALYGIQSLEAKLSGRVERVLEDLGPSWTRIRSGDTLVAGRVRISLDGIFDGAQKVANVLEAPREDVSEIRGPVWQRGSRRAAAILAAVGGIIGLGVAAGLGAKQCGRSCSDEKAGVAVALVGFPVGLGLAGYYLGGHTVEGIVYQAPPAARDGLDRITWEQLRLALPASLQGTGTAQTPRTDVRISRVPAAGAAGLPWAVTF